MRDLNLASAKIQILSHIVVLMRVASIQKLHKVLLGLATLECLFCMVLQLEDRGIRVGKLLLGLLVLSILVRFYHRVVRHEQTF